MSVPSSLIKKYVSNNVPQEDLQHAMHRWIKKYWRSLPAKGRAQLRVDLKINRPIFANIPVVVRSADGAVILDWSSPAKKVSKKNHKKYLSRKRYCRKNKMLGILKRKEKEESSIVEKETEAIPVGKKTLPKKNTKTKTEAKPKATKKKAAPKKKKKDSPTPKISKKNKDDKNDK